MEKGHYTIEQFEKQWLIRNVEGHSMKVLDTQEKAIFMEYCRTYY